MKVTFHKESDNGRRRVVVAEDRSGREGYPKGKLSEQVSDWVDLTKKASKLFCESPFGGSIEVEGTPEEVVKKINSLIKCLEKVE
jgi:hypothetical protein